jgi:hypothetical protein
VVKQNHDQPAFSSFLVRLQQLKDILGRIENEIISDASYSFINLEMESIVISFNISHS